MKNIFVFLFVFSISQFHSQIVPCIDGMSGEYPCGCYDMQSNITLEELGIEEKVSDNWGWTDALTGIEYAIICGNEKTAFIELSDPVNPIYLGYVPTATIPSGWRDVKVYNDHAFIVSEAADHGMQIFDLTRLRDVEAPPFEFDADAHYAGFGKAHNIAIHEETGYAYPIGSGPFSGGPSFINIQDPLNPVLEGGYDGDGYTHDAQIVIYDGPDTDYQGQEIMIAFNETAVTIIDVTDKNDPTQISRTSYADYSYTHQGWLDENHVFVYVNDETDELNTGINTRTMIMDCSDLDNPVFLDPFLNTTDAIDHNLYVHGNKIYQSNNASGMRVLEITGGSEPILQEVGFFDVYPEHNDAAFAGSWSVYPFFESGNIVISSRDRGFFLVSPSDEAGCSVGIEEYELTSFTIYPNPTAGELNLTLLNNEKVETLSIIDSMGKIIHQHNYTNSHSSTISIDISKLSIGLYSVIINGSSAKQFVVDK